MSHTSWAWQGTHIPKHVKNSDLRVSASQIKNQNLNSLEVKAKAESILSKKKIPNVLTEINVGIITIEEGEGREEEEEDVEGGRERGRVRRSE